jgi:hypothetical protein
VNPNNLKRIAKKCLASLKYLGKVFISHEKMVTSNLLPLLSQLGATTIKASFP